jgi:hypothetical protein
VEQAPAASAEAFAAGRSVEEAARAAGALASAATAMTGATATPPKPSRKRKQGFSNLRQVAFSPCAPDFEGLVFILVFSFSFVG